MSKIDILDEYINGAYDEDGDGVCCPDCADEINMRLDDDGLNYFCPECGLHMSREEYFDYIGANPPLSKCVSCTDNYPLCRDWCCDYDDYYEE